MTQLLQIIGITILMHIIGSTILFGYISGPVAILTAPVLSLFGWFLILPEGIGVSFQWIIYKRYPKPSLKMLLAYAVVSAVIGGVVAAPFIPKEQGKETTFWIAGFLAGAGAGVFSLLCIHILKERDGAKQEDAPKIQ